MHNASSHWTVIIGPATVMSIKEYVSSSQYNDVTDNSIFNSHQQLPAQRHIFHAMMIAQTHDDINIFMCSQCKFVLTTTRV